VSRTTHLTLKRRAFFPVRTILAELDSFLSSKPDLDYITFSGAGEPTLYSRIGELIIAIKTKYPQFKLAVITNSTLLTDAQVRKELLPCDLILPSLDAASDEVFKLINRPFNTLKAHDLISGLALLRSEFTGQMWLEVFIITGINDHPAELAAIKQAIQLIKPDRVQINSLDRPGTEDWVEPASFLVLEEIRSFLQSDQPIPVDIIARNHISPDITPLEDDALPHLISLLQKEGLSKAEITHKLGIHVNEVSKLLQHLASTNHIEVLNSKNGVSYRWKA